MKPFKKFFFFALGLSLLALVFSYFYIMSHLIVDEEPQVSDVVIVPEGEVTEERARKASQLLRDGYSRSGQVIVAPLVPANARYYAKYGVDESQIINDNLSTSTYENAVNTLAIMEEKGFDSAIVTSSDYHMNRVKFIYDRVNKDYDFDLTYVAAFHEDEEGNEVSWREAPEYIQNFARNEFPKTWAYWLGLYKLQ